MDNHQKPTQAEIKAATGKTVPDVIAPELTILFCGINPGLYTAAIGHHFGRPGNRFWPTLYKAGLTPHELSPYDERELLEYGYGITNVVKRATATADELSREEMLEGGRELEIRVEKYRPRWLAILGIGAFRIAFKQPKAKIGPQEEFLFSQTRIWVLPNPSGLNAHYDLDSLADMFRQLKEVAIT